MKLIVCLYRACYTVILPENERMLNVDIYEHSTKSIKSKYWLSNPHGVLYITNSTRKCESNVSLDEYRS